MCGFSPDFFKRKTLIHHYPLCVVGLFYHRPSPRGVPLFASMETWFTSFGEGGECSVLRHSAPVPSGCRRRAGPEPDAQVRTDVLGGRRKRATLPAWWSLGFFSFTLGFCFFFFSISPSSPGIMRHVLVNVMQWTFTKTHSVSATQFFLMQYIHL